MYLALIIASTLALGTAEKPHVAILIHVTPPSSSDPATASAEVALRVPVEIGEPLAALDAHPGARLSFAIAPAYLDAMARAAQGASALDGLAAGQGAGTGDDADDLFTALARHRPLRADAASSADGRRYLDDAARVTAAIASGAPPSMTSGEAASFAAARERLVLAEAGDAGPASATAAAALAALQRADARVLDALRADVREGKAELVALPDGEPMMPLLIDAGGHTIADPGVVSVRAKADVSWLSDEAMRACNAFAGERSGCGFYSPYGAYDDDTGALIKAAGASFALFSDRVVQGAGGHGTQAGLDAANAAWLDGYALTIDRNVTLSTLFWGEAASAQLDAVSGSTSAMGAALAAIGHDAAARASADAPHVAILRIDGDGPWAQTPDARDELARLLAVDASGAAGIPTTIAAFARDDRSPVTAYGFPPTSEDGSFALWMGSGDQLSMWRALSDARTAAGGDAAIGRAGVRAPLLAAESGAWFETPSLPLPAAEVAARLDRFRALIGSIYRTAGAAPPAVIAPMRHPSPAPSPPPSPSPTATPVPAPSASPGSS